MLFFELFHRRHRTNSHVAGVNAGDSRGDDPGKRLQIMLANEVFTRQHHGGSAIGNPGCVSGGDGSGFGENGRELLHPFDAGARNHVLVAGKGD